MAIIVRQISEVRVTEEKLREFWSGDPALLEERIQQFSNLKNVEQLFDSSEAEQLRLFCEQIAAQACPEEEETQFVLEP